MPHVSGRLQLTLLMCGYAALLPFRAESAAAELRQPADFLESPVVVRGAPATRLPQNSNPIAQPDGASTLEGIAVDIDVLANDSDPDGDSLLVSSATQGSNGSVTVAPDGRTLTYTPAPGFSGTDEFDYTIDDGAGGSATARVTVQVQSDNSPPEANDDVTVTSEDSPVTTNVVGNDTDPDGDPLDVTFCSGAEKGTVSVTGSSSCTYAPAADYNGPDGYDYGVSDGRGGEDTARVSVTVSAANDPPVAVSDAASTSEDTPVTTNVIQNDTDADGDGLSVTACSGAENGSVSRASATSCTFTPAADYSGPASYGYTVSDGKGGSDAGTVSVTVGGANDPPVAVSDAASTPEDAAVTTVVTANDSDRDGDALTVTSCGNASHGTVTRSGTTNCTYSPAANYNGPDSYTYAVGDGKGGSDNATVSVTVVPVNDPPETRIDTPVAPLTTIQVGQTVAFAGTASDPDGSGTLASYSWNFGGGATSSTKQDPGPVTFRTPGLFTVVFNVLDERNVGDPTPDTRQIQVIQPPPPTNTPPQARIDTPAAGITRIQV
nr:tandem-95 repeat protein [Gemmatimonadota bacterium]